MTFTKKQIILATVIELIIVVAVVQWWLIRPAQLWVGSVGAQSLSVGWVSRRSSVACVRLVSHWFPFESVQYCPDYGSRNVHYKDITGLRPQTTYYVMWTSGLRLDPFTLRKITTKPLVDAPHRPIPLFGSVYTKSGGPARHALVLVRPKNSQEIPLLTTTNEQGNWAADGGVFGTGMQEWTVQAVSGVGQMGQVTDSLSEGYVSDIEVRQ